MTVTKQRRNESPANILFWREFFSLLGGGVGLLIASCLQFFTISTVNFGTFSELAFSFALSPQIVIGSLLFAVLMGVLGGFLPALRAARLDILSALRAS